MLANTDIPQDQSAPIAILDSKPGIKQQECRSTLAAEAAHLGNAVETVD